MKVCVLQPDYSTTDVDYKNYDPVRDLSKLLRRYRAHRVAEQAHHLQTIEGAAQRELRHLRESLRRLFRLVDSIHRCYPLAGFIKLTLHRPNRFAVRPAQNFNEVGGHDRGRENPDFAQVYGNEDLAAYTKHLKFPMFVKPTKAGDSLGVDDFSKVNDMAALERKVKSLVEQEYDDILIEDYIPGREYTVLVVANVNPPYGCGSLKPIEYKFPKGFQYKTYALKTSELHTDVNKPIDDADLEARLRRSAEKIFNGFGGRGYARMDFRVNEKGEIYFWKSTSPARFFIPKAWKALPIISWTTTRLASMVSWNTSLPRALPVMLPNRKNTACVPMPCMATALWHMKPLKKGDVIFKLEGSSQRIITKRFVEKYWSAAQLKDFRHYAYPISDKVFILWDNDPGILGTSKPQLQNPTPLTMAWTSWPRAT